MNPTRVLFHLAFGVLYLVLLTGCATPRAALPEEPDDPFLLPPEIRVGYIAEVDAEAGIAIVRLHSASIRAPADLISRNEAMVVTARLETTRFQRGRSLGTRILAGLPNVGDEVVGPRDD
jgi:hypothetical protein